MIYWKKRCKKRETEVSHHRIWETRCGNYKIVHSHIILGNNELPDKYHAIKVEIQNGNKFEIILSTHRKKNPAIKSCEKNHKLERSKMMKRIISGAQTGADIAGLEVAKKFGFETGGTMPFGYKALDGCHPEYKKMYGVEFHTSSSYVPRTRKNVKNSDGTIRLAYDFSSKGEKCTLKAIEDYKKPYIDVDLNDPIPVSDVIIWLKNNNIQILNVAGNSEKTAPGTHAAVTEYLTNLLQILSE